MNRAVNPTMHFIGFNSQLRLANTNEPKAITIAKVIMIHVVSCLNEKRALIVEIISSWSLAVAL